MLFLKQKKILIILLSVLLFGSVILIQGKKDKTKTLDIIDTNNIKKEALELFDNAYSQTVQETGNEVAYELTAQENEIELFDGTKTKVWTYNGTVPGPQIVAMVGDLVKVTFNNNLPVETTIHWHGVRVPNAMDGVPGVTQKPINPGETFIYEFIPKDSGTFWFHPHVRGAEQVERGLYGTLIVTDENEPNYDSDTTLVVDDWRLTPEGQINPNFVTPHDLMHDGRWGSYITVNSDSQKIIDFQPGSINKLRFVNTSNARVYKLNFGNLEAKGVAVDGMKAYIQFDPNGFELSPGNRIDVVVKVKDTDIGKSYTVADTFTRDTNVLAKINVIGEVINSDTKEESLPTVPNWLDTVSLLPDSEYILDVRRSMGRGMSIEWTINDKAYPDFEPITLKHNEFNKVRFTNLSSRIHPMHLHGQFFKVIARNGVAVSEPYFRDTVLVHAKETVDIGLVPLDKGSWANHCHILEHAEAGMMTVVTVE
jgi:FtsP/CotA-like multicopper oxidase with cupredoxin domain